MPPTDDERRRRREELATMAELRQKMLADDEERRETKRAEAKTTLERQGKEAQRMEKEETGRRDALQKWQREERERDEQDAEHQKMLAVEREKVLAAEREKEAAQEKRRKDIGELRGAAAERRVAARSDAARKDEQKAHASFDAIQHRLETDLQSQLTYRLKCIEQDTERRKRHAAEDRDRSKERADRELLDVRGDAKVERERAEAQPRRSGMAPDVAERNAIRDADSRKRRAYAEADGLYDEACARIDAEAARLREEAKREFRGRRDASGKSMQRRKDEATRKRVSFEHYIGADKEEERGDDKGAMRESIL